MRFLQSGEKAMKVKDYLMDRFSLILCYIVSLCLFGLVLQLQSLLEKRSIDWNTWLYGLLLGTVVFTVYLIYDYRKRSVFLKRIEKYVTGGNGLDLALHMARLEQFAKDYKVEVVNVIDIIRGIINENRKSFIQSSVFPKVMFEEDTCMVASDRKWLSIAIGQIVVNAIKYTKISEAEKKEIQFQIEEKDQKVLLHIKDNGIGIPEQDVKRIFDPFFTGINGRKTREATGMGLYITKEICDNLHHGIYVQSAEGEGTTFTFQFAKDEEYHTLMRKMTKL